MGTSFSLGQIIGIGHIRPSKTKITQNKSSRFPHILDFRQGRRVIPERVQTSELSTMSAQGYFLDS